MAFFLLFQSVTIKSCHIPMTFLGGRGSVSFLILIKTTTPSNFVGFFIIYTYSLQKIDVAKNHKGKKSFTHTHTRSLNRSRLVCPAPYIAGIRPPYGCRCCSDTASVAARHCSGRGEEVDIPEQQASGRSVEEEEVVAVLSLLAAGMEGAVEAVCHNTGTGGTRPRTGERGLLQAGRTGTLFLQTPYWRPLPFARRHQ